VTTFSGMSSLNILNCTTGQNRTCTCLRSGLTKIYFLDFCTRLDIWNSGAHRCLSPPPPFGISFMATQHHRIFKESAYPALFVSLLSPAYTSPPQQAISLRSTRFLATWKPANQNPRACHSFTSQSKQFLVAVQPRASQFNGNLTWSTVDCLVSAWA